MESLNPSKRLKEEFVSNLTGSSMLEIASLSTICPVLILLRHSISFNGVIDCDAMKTSAKNNDDSIPSSKSIGSYMKLMVVDFLFLALPILLSFSVLTEWVHQCAFLLVIVLFLVTAVKRLFLGIYWFEVSSPQYYVGGGDVLRKYISSYRVVMMLVTCICILAVDFNIFPRRYAKTETYGTSVMDIGVGAFVLANSLVSRQARNICMVKWKTALQSTSPLLVLGFARLFTTTGVDYQVHVGEYGVHWNFFFTLAAVSILSSIINFRPKYCGTLGTLILIGYQTCLMNGLNIYLVSNTRGVDIISQNKEGIFSIFGYWGMYLIGVQLGNYLFFGDHSTTTSRNNAWVRRRVWLLCVSFWLLTVILDEHVERVSRRMCNLAYVTLVLAQTFQILGILMLSDYIPGSKSSLLEEALDQNLLGSFLLGNVLTGLVNLFMETLFTPSITALAILVLYLLALCFVTGFLHFYSVKLKFW